MIIEVCQHTIKAENNITKKPIKKTNMKQTAVEWFFRWFNDNPEATHKEYAEAFQQAKEMEKQQKQKVDKLLDTLLVNNMCSHAGDKLIEQFKKNNQ